VGIHRINTFFVEEFNSPGDLRFRIETDIRIPGGGAGKAFLRRLRRAVESSHHERVRDLLLARLTGPALKRGEKVTAADLIRVRRLVTGAMSPPRKSLPAEPPSGRRR
jgi:hypothetical protein